MPFWQRLYNTIWLAVFSCIVVPRWFSKYAAVAHVLMGLAMVALTRSNAAKLATLPVPDRLKRISKAVATVALIQLALGIALGALRHVHGVPTWAAEIAAALHLFMALAIVAQSSSLATGYDMWEEKEIGPSPTPASSGPGPGKS